MCLAFPGKVISIEDDFAKVDFGSGVVRSINVSLVDVRPGKYVLAHAGYAIQVLDEEEAEKTLVLWKEMLEAESSLAG